MSSYLPGNQEAIFPDFGSKWDGKGFKEPVDKQEVYETRSHTIF